MAALAVDLRDDLLEPRAGLLEVLVLGDEPAGAAFEGFELGERLEVDRPAGLEPLAEFADFGFDGGAVEWSDCRRRRLSTSLAGRR